MPSRELLLTACKTVFSHLKCSMYMLTPGSQSLILMTWRVYITCIFKESLVMWNVLCFLAELYCFTTDIVLLLRVVVAVCCIGIVASMFACLLDLCGTLNRCLKVVKDYSFGNVITGKLVFVNITFKNAVYIDTWVVLPFLWLLADWWATVDQN